MEWQQQDAFIFIGAMGICVRTIAPFVNDKHEDPAVVCVDSLGLNAISVLSGHIGGANDLAREVASIIGGREVITTQSDNAGLWALDTFEKRFDWEIASDEEELQDCIYAFVNRKPTALFLEVRDEGTDYLEKTKPEHVTIIDDISEADPEKYELLIMVTPFVHAEPDDMWVLHFVPMVGTIGFGLAHHPKVFRYIYDEMAEELINHGILPCSHRYCTIDAKKDEPFCRRLEKTYGEKVEFYTAEELAQVDVPNPSATVEKHVGTPSVCEAAAIVGSNHGKLIIPKIKGENWTVALAIDHKYLREKKGHIEIVGAGPGDPDLVSVRGEQCALMKEHYDKGHFIVRLHTGDPCIFGAIQEQMAFFDQQGMDYHITPGISSFLSAAAELQSQFTIPERTQTIILTRGEGRTPMPEKEQLHLLAKSQSTMCIFLSAAIVDDVQRELLQEYPEDTPVAACYHLTWPDQKIYRGLTTMLVVGEAIDNREGLSELYSKHFTHLFRKGSD